MGVRKMKRQIQLFLNLIHRTAGISALCLLTFNAQAQPVTQRYKVKGEMNSAETALVIKTPTSQLGDCATAVPPSSQVGCIYVKKNENANINIRLQGNP